LEPAIYNVIEGRGLYRVLLAATEAAFLRGIAYAVGVEVPRNVRAWNAALAERENLTDGGR